MPRSVLVIDNDAPSVKLARLVLEADGWLVMHSPDVEHALVLLQSVHLHMITTDLVPPHALALDLVRRLKAVAGNTPIVAVTSLNGPETEYRALHAGCAAFIRKPIDVSTFSAQLRAHLGDRP